MTCMSVIIMLVSDRSLVRYRTRIVVHRMFFIISAALQPRPPAKLLECKKHGRLCTTQRNRRVNLSFFFNVTGSQRR